jgi:transcriptional regulator with GAF, ATPase, and Fis domain
MDMVIDISRADKGFLILVEGGKLDVKVARNLRRENIADAVSQLSDAIVAKVVEVKRPVIISDAMNDAAFAQSQSVMNLRLTSVMCVPLLERGNLLGVIYVGNDSIANLFEAKNLEVLTVFAAQASLIIRNALAVNELQLDNRMLNEKLEQLRFGGIVGSSPPMQEVFRKVAKIALTDISVLITGETGTGKELIAREIHARSPRARGPFVSINCGAIPENLLESELFGHVRGAFTGAVANKLGRFHAADKGTLFLDEIGEMPLPLQVKILRALQERVIVRVGDTRQESVDIRVLAATNRDLEAEIKLGRFREDLYYRLNVINVHLPPLRERGDDLLVIARYLLARYAPEYGGRVALRGFAPNAIVAMRKYRWPGNIRELENRLKKAIVLSERSFIGPEDLDLKPEELPPILPLADAKEKFQRDYINEVLALNGGNRTKTARDLAVDPRTIFRHLEKEEDEGGPGDVPQEVV